MHSFVRKWPFAMLALVSMAAHAGDIPQTSTPLPHQPRDFIPTDLAVQFSAEPTEGIESGETIYFNLSVTNLGPEPSDSFIMLSSDFVDEFYLDNATTNCEAFLVQVTDGKTFHYNLSWYPAFFETLEVSETRSCHFTMALSHLAPAVLPFSFGLEQFETDLNPANDSQTVILRRGSPPATLPTLSPQALILLGLGLLACTGLRLRKR